MRPRAKVTIDNLKEVVHEKSIGTKMNDLDLYDTIRYDTIEEINVDSKAEYTA